MGERFLKNVFKIFKRFQRYSVYLYFFCVVHDLSFFWLSFAPKRLKFGYVIYARIKPFFAFFKMMRYFLRSSNYTFFVGFEKI